MFLLLVLIIALLIFVHLIETKREEVEKVYRLVSGVIVHAFVNEIKKRDSKEDK